MIMKKKLRLLLLSCAILALSSHLGAEDDTDVLFINFEAGDKLSDYKDLDVKDVSASIVEPGADGKGHCLRIQNPEPSAYASLKIKKPIEVRKNLTLSFDHREEIEAGKEGQYLGVIITDADNNEFWTSDKFSKEWRHAEIMVGAVRCSHGSPGAQMTLGKTLRIISLYGRTKDKTEARMTVWFDNIRLSAKPRASALTDNCRESYSNPPFFNWPPGIGKQKLQYSTSPDFPPGRSVTVEVSRNFYTPDKPLESGTWYWRVWTETPLFEGWSDVERINVAPEAHRFAVGPIPVEMLSKRPHPRLLEAALLDEDLSKSDLAALIKRAEGIYKRGVQPHPGPYKEGNPEWRAWVEWYGKVAGGVTGGTGRRLETIAKIAMLTKDPKVTQWAKELALAACDWDPEGGSAMKYGDIGAHHLLRGLNNCFDACYGIMTPPERAKMKEIIVARAEQFEGKLNPFRGHEANNHAWLQAYGLAESGIVLLGEHDKAAEWLDYVYQLYVGRFLCCLGYQGDNNEGLSYWGYGLGFIVDYADMMKAACGIDLYKHPWLSQTARFPMYCALPNGWGVPFADTGMPNHGMRGPVMTRLVKELALRTRDPYTLWYSGEYKTTDGLAPRPPVDLPQSIHYRHIGWVVFNTTLLDGRGAVTVAMHSGKYYAGHQHPDQNSFVIHAYGEKLAIDGGYYDWYGSPHFKAYSATTLAHNTLLVNDQGQAAFKHGADGKVTAYFDSPAYGFTTGDASNPEIYHGLLKKFDRDILFIKPDFVVIHDEVASSGEAAKYDWLLHAAAPIQADAKNERFSIECPGAALRGAFLKPANLSIVVKKGFPVEPVNRYSVDPVPSEKYVSEWTLTAMPEKPAVDAEFLVAMQVQRLGEVAQPVASMEIVAAENADAVRLKLGSNLHVILFRKRNAAEVMKGCGVESDGQVAAVELSPDGKVQRAFMQNATFLRFNGQPVIENPTPTTCSFPALPPAKPLSDNCLTINGKPSRLNGYALGQAKNQELRFWWGEVELPQSDFYDFTFEGWDAQLPPQVTWDAAALDIALHKTPHYSAWITEGPHYITILGTGVMSQLTIKGQGARPVPALMLSKEFKPAPGSLIIEAENVSAEGPVKGKVVKKVGASGGVAHCNWDKDGQWAEWQFDAPKAGDYELLIRGAGENDPVLREVSLDGQPLSPKVRVVQLSATGGWCRTQDDWRFFILASPDKKPFRLTLSPGKHALRLQRIGGSMNIDLFALQPAE
jgi:hypothetical protein